MLTLFGLRPRGAAVAQVADELRQEIVGDVVTWVANRNINYTNVCTFKCRFAASPRAAVAEPPWHPLPTRTRGHRRSHDRGRRGRRNRGVSARWYPSQLRRRLHIDVARAVHEAVPGMHIHGFTALEVTEVPNAIKSRWPTT